MKKILAGLILVSVMAMFVPVQSAPIAACTPAAPTLYNQNVWNQAVGCNIYVSGNSQSTNSKGGAVGARDSLKGVDSMFFLNKYPTAPGYQYIAQIYDSAGAADSAIVYYRLYSMDGKYALGNWLIADSADFTHGSSWPGCASILIPTNTTAFAGFISLKIIKYTATLVSKIFRFELIERRTPKSAIGF